MESLVLSKKNKNIKRDAFIASVILLVSAGPYFFWWLLSSPVFTLLKLLFVFICYKHSSIQKSDKGLIALFSFGAFWSVLIALIHGDANLFGLISQLSYVFFFYIFFTERQFAEKVFSYFLAIYVFIILFSVASWALASIGVLSPVRSMSFMQSGEKRTYDIYPFLVKEVGYDIRFYGPFDEPGSIGTISGLLLCITRFSFKKWQTWVLLISGVISLSLFFFVLVTIGLIWYILFVKRNLVVAGLICALLAVFYIKTSDDPILYTYMWSRLEWNDDSSSFNGDKRMTEEGDMYLRQIRGTSEYFLGVNNVEKFWQLAEGSSSYKVVIATQGLIFFILYVLYFLLFAWRKKTSFLAFALFCLVFLSNIYQRPAIYNILIMFLCSELAQIELAIPNRTVKRKLQHN